MNQFLQRKETGFKVADFYKTKKTFTLGLTMLFLSFVLSIISFGQTPVSMSSQGGLTYTENFADVANWTNNFAAGIGASAWGSVDTASAGTIGDGKKITKSTSTFSTGFSGGVQKGSSNIAMLSTSTANSCAIDFYVSFSGVNAGVVSFDLAQVSNSTGDRDSKLKLFYTTDGVLFTEITGTNLPFTARNNVASSASISVSLPSVLNNASNVRLRLYEYSTSTGTTPTGSQPKISIDNFTVTATSNSSPALSFSALSSFGSVCVNTTAGPNKFTLSGSNLTAGNIKVGPLSGYTFSRTSAGTYTDSLLISQAGGTLSDFVFVKFNPTAVQSYNGNISISGGSATAINVAAVGSGVSATSVTTGSASSITTTGVTLNGTLTQGCSVVTAYGMEYSTTNNFTPGTGTAVASTNLLGSTYSLVLNGLTASTTYYYVAYITTGSGTLYGTQSSFTTNTPSAGNASIVISQLYGAGGNPGALYNADYVELHNTSNTTQTISNYSIQYASATATGTWSGRSKLPTLSIPAGGYYLIQMSTVGAVGVALPTPDYVASPTISMSQTNGRVALVSDTVALSACPTTSNIVDLVGYGTSVCSETAAVPALDTIHAGFRNNKGCDDTNNNLADFTINTPLPRNSASSVFICGTLPTTPTLTANTLTSFGGVCINTTAGPNSFTLNGTNLVSGDLTVAALTGFSYSLTSGGAYTSTLTIPQSGGTLVATTIYVKFNPTAVQSYNGNISISGGGATAITVAAVGSGVSATSVTTGNATSITTTGVTLNGTLTQGCSVVTAYGMEYSTTNNFTPGTGTAVASTNLSGSSYTVALTGLTASTTYYYVTYVTTGSGTTYGTQSSFTTSTPQVSATGVVISQIYGAGSNTGATYNADYVELHNNTNTTQDISGHKILYGSTSGLLGSTSTNRFTFPSNTTIPAGGYILVAAAAGITGANLPVTPDFTFTLNMSGVNGKVAFGTSSMVDSTTYALQPAGVVLDFVGYGTANESETTPVAALTATTATFRNNYGCDDTNNNLADLTNQTPLPRSSASPVHICGVTPANPVLTSGTLTSFGAVCVNTTVGPNKFTISGTSLTAGNIKVGPLSGYTFSRTSAGTYTDSLSISQAGGTFSDSVFVKFNPTSVQSYNGNISVSGGGATAINVAAVGSGVSSTSVATGLSSAITTSGATLSGTLTQGCSLANAYGIVYSTINGFTPSSGIFTSSNNLAGTSYSINASGLNASTTYYYVAYAISGVDTLYGTQSSFTTNTPSGGNASIVISQLYGAGGNPGALYNADYVELHNTSNTTQTISNYSIQYASATATGTWSGRSKLPNLSIPAGGYYLIQMSAVGAVGVALPTPDNVASPTISMSQTNGRVALVSDTASLSACPTTSVIVDLVGYGTSVCSETSAVPALDTIHAGFRNNKGCDDTNNNLADFTLNTPLPRNSASPVFICGTLPTTPTLTANTLTSFGGVCINTTAGPNSFTLNGTNLVSGDLTVAALTGFSYSLTSGGTYTSTLTIPQSGGTLVATTIYVKFNPTAVQSYNGNISISGGDANTINVAVVGSGVSIASVSSGTATAITTTGATVAGSLTQGCTAISSYGVVYSTSNGFTPASGSFVASTNLSGSSYSAILSGLTSATTYYYVTYAISGSDTIYGSQLSFTTNTPSTGGGTGVKISQIYGGGGSATGTFNADYVELHNNGSTAMDISGYKIMYGSAAGNLATTNTNAFTFPAGVTIPAGAYILVATTAGTGLASLPVTPDYTFTLNMSGTNGKIAFGTADMTSNTTYALQPAGAVLDFVGYGTASESETAATPALNSTSADFRNNGGCDDTNNNLADFTVATPLPRNSASPINLCNAVPSGPTLFGGTITSFGDVAVGTNSNSQSFSLSGLNLTGAPGVITVTAPNYFMVSTDNVNWSSSLAVNYTDSTLASTTIYVMFAPQSIGTQTGNINISGGGAASINVAVAGNGVTTSVISVSSIAGFGEVCINSIAGPNSFDISGANFTTDNLVVGPLAGYTFSNSFSGP